MATNMIHQKISGTKEWANTNINLFHGCSNDCRYCYAKKMAIRFGRKTKDNWKVMVPNTKAMAHQYRKREGVIMFPSSHDLTDDPGVLETSVIILTQLLQQGNTVLIVTKPRLNIIRVLCDTFLPYQSQLQFRFTISSNNSETLKWWEPGAPSFEERFTALLHAYHLNYKTSVSMEPFLDYNPVPLVTKLLPYVAEVWLGCMHYIDREGLLPEEIPHYEEVRKNYTYENLMRIFQHLRNEPKVRWKDSIQNAIYLIQV